MGSEGWGVGVEGEGRCHGSPGKAQTPHCYAFPWSSPGSRLPASPQASGASPSGVKHRKAPQALPALDSCSPHLMWASPNLVLSAGPQPLGHTQLILTPSPNIPNPPLHPQEITRGRGSMWGAQGQRGLWGGAASLSPSPSGTRGPRRRGMAHAWHPKAAHHRHKTNTMCPRKGTWQGRGHRPGDGQPIPRVSDLHYCFLTPAGRALAALLQGAGAFRNGLRTPSGRVGL